MRRIRSIVGVALMMAACRPSPTPAESPAPPVDDRAVPHSAVIDAGPSEPEPEPEPAGGPCSQDLDRAELEACMKAIGPQGDAWTPGPTDFEPKGYVCAFFGAGACKDNVVPVAHWVDGTNEDCPVSMALYWAPQESQRLPQGWYVGSSRRLYYYMPSDGTLFAFVRIDDHVVEVRSCMDDETNATQAALTWSAALTDVGMVPPICKARPERCWPEGDPERPLPGTTAEADTRHQP